MGQTNRQHVGSENCAVGVQDPVPGSNPLSAPSNEFDADKFAKGEQRFSKGNPKQTAFAELKQIKRDDGAVARRYSTGEQSDRPEVNQAPKQVQEELDKKSFQDTDRGGDITVVKKGYRGSESEKSGFLFSNVCYSQENRWTPTSVGPQEAQSAYRATKL
ncbi:hypothetical protein BB558_000026 [Smittium angustum]|uniref:Uncharacterized protein n=1 Tax=Smittium angustum TaxID=133377 RepID=A0A2U1JFY1_SMIAN|nr:hypothetical protein BB558_000026 [Smittium angustum]